MITCYLIKLCINFEHVISVILVMSCVYNYVNSPDVMCVLEECDRTKSLTMVAMFPRAVAIACMISRLTELYKNSKELSKYRKKIEIYDVYFTTDVYKKKLHRAFIATIVSIGIIVIMPINIYRIHLIYYHHQSIAIVFFILIMYVQNVFMFMTEINFISYCFGLYQKFQLINKALSELKSETIVKNKYPYVLKPDEHDNNCVGLASNDRFPSKIKVRSLANTIEQLKMRHTFVRDAVGDLNDLFGIQLGTSLCVLFIMTLFDIYEVITNELNITKTTILLYGWLLQYALRFCAIVLTTHFTTRQVSIC